MAFKNVKPLEYWNRVMDIFEEFQSELTEGDIRFRDNLQFELKSEFFINPDVKNNIYAQEFYLFIPSTLQINKQTYTKEQFYLDQTNLIRYKTPHISLKNLVLPQNYQSPLIRLQEDLEDLDPDELKMIVDELKLFGNIFRADLRRQTRLLITKLNDKSHDWQRHTQEFSADITAVRDFFLKTKAYFFQRYPEEENLKDQWDEIDEFVSHTIEYYLTCILKMIRDSKIAASQEIDQLLCDMIIKEQNYCKLHKFQSEESENKPYVNESILYRNSLLNKFMLEALSLNSNRYSLQEKQGHVLGAASAGIAMFFYLLLFTWKNPTLAINSLSLIFFVVVLYVLKDRLKEGLKSFYYRQAARWFPDYSTEIKNRRGKIIGKLNENFSIIEESKLSSEILKIRTQDFHGELPKLRRQETIILYKKEVVLYQPGISESRRRELTTIFRFNIHQFLQKANNALQPHLVLNPDNLEIVERLLPKVYHINLIIHQTHLKSSQKMKTAIKKFRVVIDKFGIKRVEQIK
jgi:hypothetical protein